MYSLLWNCLKYLEDLAMFEIFRTFWPFWEFCANFSNFNILFQVCQQDGKRRFLSTIMLLGLIIGSLFGGYICDTYGRKKTMFVAVLIIIPSVMLGGFSPNYETYVCLRLLTCIVIPSVWIGVHSMTLEIFDRLEDNCPASFSPFEHFFSNFNA